MIGHRTRFRESDDLPPWQSPAAKKKPPLFNAHALISRKIIEILLVFSCYRNRDKLLSDVGLTFALHMYT